MLLQNLRASWRSIRKHRFHSILNIFGFSFALTVVILLGMFVQRELSTNMFHDNVKQIYKVYSWGAPYPLGETLRTHVPEMENLTMVRVEKRVATAIYEEKPAMATYYLETDNNFFEVFTFPIVQGDAKEPLTLPNSVVITESLARRLFGDEDPVLKNIGILEMGGAQLVITAVVKDPPLNSSIKFDMLLRADPDKPVQGGRMADSWSTYYYEFFVKLPKGQNIETLNEKNQGVVARNSNMQPDFIERVKLFPFKDLYFNPGGLYTRMAGGDHGKVMAMMWIGIIILLVSIINFFNLSTASGMLRSKEIGLRKINGSTRGMIMTQFVAESVILTFVSMIIAIGVANLLIPWFGRFVGAEYHVIMMDKWWAWLLLPGGSLTVGLFAGSYPAVVLSKTDPINALYTGRDTTGFGVVAMRRILVVFQLVVSI